MGSSHTITLFSDVSLSGRPSFSFLVSILMHGAAAGLVALGVLGTPQLALPLTAQRYTVRSLDLRAPEVRRAYSDSVAYPGPSARTRRASRPSPPGAKPPASALHLPQTAQAKLGPQTLIQPDVRDPVVLAHVTPLPSVVIWAPEKTPVRNIVPPQPHKLTATERHALHRSGQ